MTYHVYQSLEPDKPSKLYTSKAFVPPPKKPQLFIPHTSSSKDESPVQFESKVLTVFPNREPAKESSIDSKDSDYSTSEVSNQESEDMHSPPTSESSDTLADITILLIADSVASQAPHASSAEPMVEEPDGTHASSYASSSKRAKPPEAWFSHEYSA